MDVSMSAAGGSRQAWRKRTYEGEGGRTIASPTHSRHCHRA